MTPYELIIKKRDGGEFTKKEIDFFIEGCINGSFPDYQMSSLLMAVYFQGMTFDETTHLTRAMLHSGEVIDLNNIPGVKVDKHSTGGVGDKVSLVLAPLVAAAGVPVPMISGRGLGHTGGTLDKLESIPGFNVNLSVTEYRNVIDKIGVAMIGQTETITPADRKLYALRDVTGTVPSVPFICGSILSKKLAEGIDALVLDVKTGRGAFMQTTEDSIELAKFLVKVGNNFGKKTVAFITDMNQPLGNAVGNWLEMKEAIDTLKGDGPKDFMNLTLTLSAQMLILGEKAKTKEDAFNILEELIHSGKAYQKLLELVETQSGDVSIVEHPENYKTAHHQLEVRAETNGFIEEIDVLELGLISVALGGGRIKLEDKIDTTAGFYLDKKRCDEIKKSERLFTAYSDNPIALETAKERLKNIYKISNEKPSKQPLIYSFIDMNGHLNEYSK